MPIKLPIITNTIQNNTADVANVEPTNGRIMVKWQCSTFKASFTMC